MANDLMQTAGQVPAHIVAAFGTGDNADLSSGVSGGYPIISIKGKVFHIVENGERMLVTADGSDDPAPSIMAVILRANPNLNKVYYPDGYDEGSTEKPLCHSNDAIAPAADAQEPQSPKCATCKFNQFGTKISDNGSKGKACADSRRLAVAPHGDLERAMLLRVPAASLRTLLAYAQGLDKRKVPYQALVTRIGFDHSVAYPALTFKAEAWLDAEEVAEVKEMMDSATVLNITALDQTGHAVVEEKKEEKDDFLPPRNETKTERKPEPEPEPKAEAPKTTGFGGGGKTTKKADPPPQEQETTSSATTLAAGAMSELDAVLGNFDDEAEGGEAEEQ